jgi:preprotein translocase subunit YajC
MMSMPNDDQQNPFFVLFAQSSDGGPALAGEGVASTEGGAGTGATGQAAEAPGGDLFLWMVLPLILMMIAFSVFGGRKEKKKRDALMASIKKHDRVRTIGGVIGSIVEVKNDTVLLKVDESSNTRMTFSRDAVQQVLDSTDATS